MDQSTINFLNTGGAVACLIVPAAELIVNKHKRGKRKPLFRRITPFGWALLAVSIFLFVNTFLSNQVAIAEKLESKKMTDSRRKADDSINGIQKRADRDSIISEVNKALQKNNQRYDPSTGTVVSVRPILIASPMYGSNPVITEAPTNDTLWFRYVFTNLNSALAKNLRTVFAIISKKNGKLVVSSSNANVFNETISITNKSDWQVEKPIYNRYNYTDTSYIYMKVSFTNDGGETQPPFRSVHMYYPGQVNKDLYIPIEFKFLTIKRFLQDHKLW
jgi:hypothetical protein